MKSLFLLTLSPPSKIDYVETKLEYRHNVNTAPEGGKGEAWEGKHLILTSYCVSVPRVLTRVVV